MTSSHDPIFVTFIQSDMRKNDWPELFMMCWLMFCWSRVSDPTQVVMRMATSSPPDLKICSWLTRQKLNVSRGFHNAFRIFSLSFLYYTQKLGHYRIRPTKIPYKVNTKRGSYIGHSYICRSSFAGQYLQFTHLQLTTFAAWTFATHTFAIPCHN